MSVKLKFKFANGDEVKEKVSGFVGVITGSVKYLTGCNQYLVSASSKDPQSEPVAIWYDEGRLELVISNKIKYNEVSAEDNGCDIAPPIR
jgi:hypothetical protein